MCVCVRARARASVRRDVVAVGNANMSHYSTFAPLGPHFVKTVVKNVVLSSLLVRTEFYARIQHSTARNTVALWVLKCGFTVDTRL